MSATSNIKILITGARGFIGSRVAAYLSASHPGPLPEGEGVNYDIYGLSRNGFGDTRLRGDDSITWIQGDFADEASMSAMLSDIRPNIIIHCAGVTPHQGVRVDDYTRVNIDGGRSLLEAVDSGLRRNDGFMGFINCSTIGVYGAPTASDGIVRVDDDCHPLSPYAQSKYDFEQILAGSGVPYLNMRIANIPGRDAFINHVVDKAEVESYGDAPYVRDYIHMDDLCAMFEKGIEHLNQGGESLTLNAGAGVGFAFPDIVDEIERQTGQSIKRHHRTAKEGDVIKILCDIALTKRVLDFVPAHTTLTEIVNYALRHR